MARIYLFAGREGVVGVGRQVRVAPASDRGVERVAVALRNVEGTNYARLAKI
jgi:hypothetical protein